MKTSRKSHCLICLARSHGIAIPTILPIGQTLVLVALTAGWTLGMVFWTVAAAIVIPRQRRRSIGMAMDRPAIESNPPTVEAVTIPAQIVGTMPADVGIPISAPVVVEVPTDGRVDCLVIPAAADVDAGCVDDMSSTHPVEPVSIDVPQNEPESCTVEALAWMNARNAAADAEARASDRQARRRKATVAACKVSRPQAALDRAVADAEAAGEQGKAFLARRAEQKAEEVKELAGLPVKRLRQFAARMGHKGTRTARKAELLALLVG
jgi:hypothetical protein